MESRESDCVPKLGFRSTYLEALEALEDSQETLSDTFHTTLREKLEVLKKGHNTFSEEEMGKAGIPVLDIWGDMTYKSSSPPTLEITELPSSMLWIRAIQEGYSDVCEFCRKNPRHFITPYLRAIPLVQDDPAFLDYLLDTQTYSGIECGPKGMVAFCIEYSYLYGKLLCLKELEKRGYNLHMHGRPVGVQNMEFLNYVLHKGYIGWKDILHNSCSDEVPPFTFERNLKFSLERLSLELCTEIVRNYLTVTNSIDHVRIIRTVMPKVKIDLYVENNNFLNNKEILEIVLKSSVDTTGMLDASDSDKCVARLQRYRGYMEEENLKMCLRVLPVRCKERLTRHCIDGFYGTGMSIRSTLCILLRDLASSGVYLCRNGSGSIFAYPGSVDPDLVQILYSEDAVDPGFLFPLTTDIRSLNLKVFRMMYSYYIQKGTITLEFRNFLISEYRRRGRDDIVDFLKKTV